jgi:hypothetical protein
MNRCLLVFVVVAGLAWNAAFPSRAVAWGKEGHELVGKIADKHLTKKARSAIDELLQDHQFRSLSDGRLTNWADSIRGSAVYRKKYPKMAQWHFIDIDVDAKVGKKDLAKFCPNGDCALKAIKRFQDILKDPGNDLRDRREALFFIAHFIGDIHQPLHCAERKKDRGGNLVRVFHSDDDRHVTNLHKVWDTNLVQDAVGRLTLEDYATRLTNTLSTQRRKELQKGTVEDWILESYSIAREKVYKDKDGAIPAEGAPHTLSPDYLQQGAEIVEEQLTKGGVRLAQFLNDTFKD